MVNNETSSTSSENKTKDNDTMNQPVIPVKIGNIWTNKISLLIGFVVKYTILISLIREAKTREALNLVY